MKAFEGELAFLSNMYPAPISFFVGEKEHNFASVEVAYQFVKGLHALKNVEHPTVNKEDLERMKELTGKNAGYDAKRMARSLKLPRLPEGVSLPFMNKFVALKFLQHFDLATSLIATEGTLPTIVEYNYWHDNFWGECRCPKCLSVDMERHNHLGKILMNVRSFLLTM